MFTIDHLAFPCFDIAGTVRFYTALLGGTLRYAQSGPAEVWNAKEYLLLAFELPGGVVIDFFSFDGIRRPAGGSLPKDIYHFALSVRTPAEVAGWRDRFEQNGVPFWVETHEVSDLHVYATDPNGLTLEVLAEEDGVRGRKSDEDGARRVLDGWLAARGHVSGVA